MIKLYSQPVVQKEVRSFPLVIEQTLVNNAFYILTQVTQIQYKVEKLTQDTNLVRKCSTYKKAYATYRTLIAQ